METIAALYNYWIVVALMCIALYIIVAQHNLIKKIIGLNIFQTSIFIFYISVGNVDGGTAPILDDGIEIYSNPLPHVLMLTAIVVAVSTLGVALALAMKIYQRYRTLDEDEILARIEDGSSGGTP